MLLSDKKESPIRGITGLGGGIASYIFYGSGAGGEYEISRSLRFNSADSAYLSRDITSANRDLYTFSCWVKRGAVGVRQDVVDNLFIFLADDTLIAGLQNGGSGSTILQTTQVFRDPSAWYHLLFVANTASGTSSERFKLYVNGVQVTTFSVSNYPGQNVDTNFGSVNPQTIGKGSYGSSGYFSGYLADVHFIDGQVPTTATDDANGSVTGTPNAEYLTTFGEFDDNGVWQPIEYTGTYGTNDFHLDFSDNSSSTALGTDSSGQNNNWTVHNLYPTPSTKTINRVRFKTDWQWMYVSAIEINGTILTTGTLAAGNWLGGDLWKNGVTGSGNETYSQSARGNWFDVSLSSNISNFRNIRIFVYLDNSAGSTTNIFELELFFTDGTSILKTYPGSGNAPNGNFNQRSWQDFGNLFSESDSLLDSPTNDNQTDTGVGGQVVGNYATFNPLQKNGGITLTNGNLKLQTTNNFWKTTQTTIGMKTGKFYWEYGPNLWKDSNNHCQPGVAGMGIGNSNEMGATNYTAFYHYSGTKFFNGQGGSGSSFGDPWSDNATNIIGVAFDADTRQVWFSKNGVWQGSGNPSAGTNEAGVINLYKDGTYSPTLGAYGSLNNGGADANFGQRPFVYPAPSGFKCLCTANLSTPSIADGSTAFNATLYTGDGNARNISTPYSPDLVWIKGRSNAYDHGIFDVQRGANQRLSSNSNGTSGTEANSVTAFNSDSFSLGTLSFYNNPSTTFVAWNWNAGANSNKTYTVKVVGDSGNKYRFDDFGNSAVTLELEEGSTYVFDASDSSVDGHPFVLGTSANSNEYSTGVTYRLDGSVVTYAAYTSGFTAATTRTLTITVPASAPTLYYWCSVHSGMGGQVNTNTTAGASNFSGSIQSKVRANPSAGFSIVTYTGNAISGATIGHGLNAAPEMILTKNTESTTNWRVYHNTLGNTKVLFLSTTGVADTSAVYWNNTSPTSTVFTSGSDDGINGNGNVMIAYCFAPVEGYSSFGSYTGNGTADGPFVYTGFRPKFLLLKNADDGWNWQIRDTARETYNNPSYKLAPNLGVQENDVNALGGITTSVIDWLSNGFKIRDTFGGTNASSEEIIYAAFAEHPFKTTRAR